MTLTEGEERIWISSFVKNFHNRERPIHASKEKQTEYDKWVKQHAEDAATQAVNVVLHLRELKTHTQNKELSAVLEQILR